MEVANDHTHPGAFQTTLWTVVRDAGEQASVALEQLCENYWAPLYGYALKSGYDQHQAKDLTQGFFHICWEARCSPKRIHPRDVSEPTF